MTMKTQSITLTTNGTNFDIAEANNIVETLNEPISTCIPTTLWRRGNFRSLNYSLRSRWPPKYSMNSNVSSRRRRCTIENKLYRPSIRSNNKQIFYRTRMNAKNWLYILIQGEPQRRVAPILAAISQVILMSQILLFHRQLSYNKNILSGKQNNWDKTRERYILSSIISSSMKKIACKWMMKTIMKYPRVRLIKKGTIWTWSTKTLVSTVEQFASQTKKIWRIFQGTWNRHS